MHIINVILQWYQAFTQANEFIQMTYGIIALITIILWAMLWANYHAFKYHRVVMGCKQLLITIITTSALWWEPTLINLHIGYQVTIAGFSGTLTPTCIIWGIGILWCGILNARLNHRIWRAKYPTLPYPKDLSA